METLCPSELAEEWDNCGIQIDTEYDEVNRVLVALEVTEAVIREAEEVNADMISPTIRFCLTDFVPSAQMIPSAGLCTA